MIRLKSGKMVEFINDFDLFFQDLMKNIIDDAYRAATEQNSKEPSANFSSLILKELMDESIYVTHQLFELSKHNEKLAKFMVTGFIFNSLALSVPALTGNETDEPSGNTVH